MLINTSNITTAKPRITWIDFAKGIAIISMIIGHSVGAPLRDIIYTFHMPFFYIVSGITFKPSKNNTEFLVNAKKSFIHLISPAFIMILMSTVIELISILVSNGDRTIIGYFLANKLLAILFSNGMPLTCGALQIGGIGVPWFFISLFLCRITFDYLQMKLSSNLLIFVCSILCVLGVIIGQFQWLPLSYDLSLVMLPMFLFGTHYNKLGLDKYSHLKLILFSLFWLVTLAISKAISYDYLELTFRRYPLFPACLLIAILGTVALTSFSQIATNFKVSSPITYLGKNSIYMLYIHNIDYMLFNKLWTWTSSGYLIIICRLTVDGILFAAFMLSIRIIKSWNK